MVDSFERFQRPDYQMLTGNIASSTLIQPQQAKTQLEKPAAGGSGALIGPITEFTGFLVVATVLSNAGQPNYAEFIIDLNRLSLGPAWVVSGNVTEIASDGFTPHIGAAAFRTDGTVLDQAANVAIVYFRMYWNWPLPVGAMITVGHGLGTL